MVGPFGYAGNVWSSAGGVSGLGDGVGEGDNDSGGVEQVECYTPAEQRTVEKKHIKGKNTC